MENELHQQTVPDEPQPPTADAMAESPAVDPAVAAQTPSPQKEDPHPVLTQTIRLTAGEILAVALTTSVYALIGKFSFGVLLGGILGMAVTVINFLILALAVDSLTRQIIAARGNAELTEEEQIAFIAQNKNAVDKRAKISYLVRSVALVGLLVVALITKWFDPIATLVPLLLYRPILMLSELIFSRIGK